VDFDWKGLVRTVAPTIASVFGTPMAGLGVTALLKVLLPEDTPAPEHPEAFIAQAIQNANPEMLQKIKAAEQEFLKDMKTLDIDLTKTLQQFAAQNTAGARELKTSWLKSGVWDYEPVLAFLVCGAFGYAEYWVFAHAAATASMDPGGSVLIGRVLGTVDAAFMLLLSFRWGTTHSNVKAAEGNGTTPGAK
jgi:hypothetical protein